jgi:hypothetical protein
MRLTADVAANPLTPEVLPGALANLQRWVVASLVAALPVGIGVGRAYWMASGDYQVMSEILRRLDVVAFLSSTVFLLLQSGALLLAIATFRILLVGAIGASEANRRFPPRHYAIVMGILALLFLVLSPGLALALPVLGIVGIAAPSSIDPDKHPRIRRLALVLSTLSIVLIGFIILKTPSPPAEVVQVRGEPAKWAYVLVVEDTHTTILYPEGGLERIPNDDVDGRALCPQWKLEGGTERFIFSPMESSGGPSLLRLALRKKNEHVPTLCKTAPVPPPEILFY